MTREEFEKKLAANGYELIDDVWVMTEQPPKPWARMGARIRGNKYDSIVFFASGKSAVSERGLRFEQSRTLFAKTWEDLEK